MMASRRLQPSPAAVPSFAVVTTMPAARAGAGISSANPLSRTAISSRWRATPRRWACVADEDAGVDMGSVLLRNVVQHGEDGPQRSIAERRELRPAPP